MEKFYQNTTASMLERRLIAMKWSSVSYVFGQGLLQTMINYVF